MDQIRECGECDLCCKWLVHDVYGQLVSPKNPCRFIKNGCSIHPNRPHQCKTYYCMWAQGVLPEWMYPKDIGVMVSVKDWTHGQWLELVECGEKMTDEVINAIVEFKCPYTYIKEGDLFVVGPSEFREYYKNYAKTNSDLLSSIPD